MAERPRLLDLFCGAGGAARGYQAAGFHVTGIDVRPQPRYAGDAFVQGDALEYLPSRGREFDAAHASPPCQRYSRTQRIHGREYVDLLPRTRAALVAAGLPWVMENVEEAPMGGIVLCGTHFGLRVIRHRRFESSVFLWAPPVPCRPPAGNRCVQVGRAIRPGQFVTVAGNISGVRLAGEAMGIGWMRRRELVQAIPPAYAEFIGRQLRRYLEDTPGA